MAKKQKRHRLLDAAREAANYLACEHDWKLVSANYVNENTVRVVSECPICGSRETVFEKKD